MIGYLIRLAAALFLMAVLIDTPFDALILIAGLLAAGPIARVVLRATRIAGPLARIAWPIRLVLGFAATVVFAIAFLGVVGVSPLSRFFNMVVAVAVGLVIMELFLAADDVAGVSTRTRARAAAEGIVLGALLVLALPTVVLAHDGEATADAAAGAAVAGAAAAAAATRRRQGQKAPPFSRPPVLPPGFHRPPAPPKPSKAPEEQPAPDGGFFRGLSNAFKNVYNGFKSFFGGGK
jgi:hypothetical protein